MDDFGSGFRGTSGGTERTPRFRLLGPDEMVEWLNDLGDCAVLCRVLLKC